MKKFLSRKFLVAIATGISSILIATGNMPNEAKPLVIAVAGGIAGLYIAVEGLIDLLKKN
jgi:hypothetical protein